MNYTENLINYTKTGANFLFSKKKCRKDILMCGLLVLFSGIFNGWLKNGKELNFVMILLCFIYVFSAVLTFMICTKKSPEKNRFLASFVCLFNMQLNFLFMGISLYCCFYKPDTILAVVILPAVILPIILLYENAVFLKKRIIDFKKRKTSLKRISILASFGSAIGILISKAISSSITNEQAVIICITGFLIISYIFSLGYLDLQRFYYCIKLEKSGINLETIFNNESAQDS